MASKNAFIDHALNTALFMGQIKFPKGTKLLGDKGRIVVTLPDGTRAAIEVLEREPA